MDLKEFNLPDNISEECMAKETASAVCNYIARNKDGTLVLVTSFTYDKYTVPEIIRTADNRWAPEDKGFVTHIDNPIFSRLKWEDAPICLNVQIMKDEFKRQAALTEKIRFARDETVLAISSDGETFRRGRFYCYSPQKGYNRTEIWGGIIVNVPEMLIFSYDRYKHMDKMTVDSLLATEPLQLEYQPIKEFDSLLYKVTEDSPSIGEEVLLFYNVVWFSGRKRKQVFKKEKVPVKAKRLAKNSWEVLETFESYEDTPTHCQAGAIVKLDYIDLLFCKRK